MYSPHCKALPWQWNQDKDLPMQIGCRCKLYEPQSNLEYLESLVGNNYSSRKV